ncbi:peroxidase-related enzyme [Cytophagaceae bacterium AH-315-L13]|nr:peroxidase-related enzyme [Cytophagaceae bacterium AH-315-L13]
MAYIYTIPPENATNELKKVYEDIKTRRGKLADVHKIFSLNPDAMLKHMELYQSVMFGKSPLKRYQREMMAVIVSIANKCEYCILHHCEALNHFWKDDKKVKQLQTNYKSLELPIADKQLCYYAWDLTKNPKKINQKYIDELKKAGLNDRTILDANLVIAYFNFVNRTVLGLGVYADTKEVTGYNYE